LHTLLTIVFAYPYFSLKSVFVIGIVSLAGKLNRRNNNSGGVQNGSSEPGYSEEGKGSRRLALGNSGFSRYA
jgi:hypothetical protein